MDLQSFQRLFLEPFDPMYCPHNRGWEPTCWADSAYNECGAQDRGAQEPYTLVMEATDVRMRYKLRLGCGKLTPQQCLAEDVTTSTFQGTACNEILRNGICANDTNRFWTCVGQGRCACPVSGEVGYVEGAVWGLSSGCSSSNGCQAGCTADGQSFTGGALTAKQLSDLASVASDGETKLTQAIDKLTAHISGTSVLSNTNLIVQSTRFAQFAALLKRTPALVEKAFDLVDVYERSSDGPLFVKRGSFARAGENDGHALERAMLLVQQAIMDDVYRAGVLAECSRAVFAGRGWLTAAYYPGAAAPPADDSTVHSVVVKANVPAVWGRPVGFAQDDAQKPTGLYLSPGAIGVVTVPQNLVGKGYQVLVGAQVSDNKWKSPIMRMDRVTVLYDITSVTTLVANPLGGGLYIMVPYLADAGLVEVQITGGVIKAPLFRRTSFDKMTNADWLTHRTAPAPWADFETDKFMLNVPRSWIYAYEDAESLMVRML